MQQTQVFEVDQKNKYIKQGNKIFKSLIISPLITLTIMLIFFIISYLIGTEGGFNNNFIVEWIANNAIIVIRIFIGIVILQMFLGILRIIKNFKIQNSLIIKDGKDIMILYRINTINQSSASLMVTGGLAMDKNSIVNASLSNIINIKPNLVSLLGLSMYLIGRTNAKIEAEEKIQPLIKEIIDNPKSNYKFYTDCKLIKETNKYYLFNGNNINYAGEIKNENFKIHKIYSNIEKLVEK